jgi:methyl-accepting chemotaxis protein
VLWAALLCVLALAPAAQAEPVPVLDGWSYRWGDSPPGAGGVPAWAAETGAAEGWAPVAALHVPPGRGNQTMLWLSIPIPAGSLQAPALFLRSVANAFEVYAHGQRIYTSGQLNPAGREVPETMMWHLVPLPPNVQGSRVLLRIQGTGPAIGVAQGAQVGEHHELLASGVRSGLAIFVMGVVLLAIGFVSAGAAILRRQRLLVAVTVFAGGAGLLLVGCSGLFAALWDATALGTRLLFVGAYGLLPGLGWFIADGLVEGRLRWFRRAAGVVSVLAIPQIVVVFFDMGVAQSLLKFLTLYTMPGLLLCVGVAAVEAWKGNPDARIFVAGLGMLFASLIHASLPWLRLIEDGGGNYMHWGFLALTLSLVGVVGRRSTVVARSLTLHARQLEMRRLEVRALAEGMSSSAGELATVVQQLRTSSEEQTAGISRQATALQQLEQTVQEIRQGSQLAAEKALQLGNAAGSAGQMGQEGGAAIERTLSNLEAIRAEVSGMASRILALDARTREVSGIVDTVKTLADQSNMLAINAAIEAVRSGDSGKGFGVVAREMRSLADQSIQATQRIRDVLDGVSASMREAAKVSEQGEHRVQLSLDAVRTSGAQLQKLASIVGDTSTSVRQITAAVAQQDAGTSQIAQAIQELSSQMRRTLKVVEETQAVTRAVQSLSGKMSDVSTQVLQSGVEEMREAPGR